MMLFLTTEKRNSYTPKIGAHNSFIHGKELQGLHVKTRTMALVAMGLGSVLVPLTHHQARGEFSGSHMPMKLSFQHWLWHPLSHPHHPL